ncbi:MAG: hypothetical protein KZQ93_12345 [Candidatus Thiodiazotropha sp. (ex Monitilora ramsayi)]|nr:hypothetical protein [Candidatus Thiodiazotropha sp. (ex Monitilora ramsayi)]
MNNKYRNITTVLYGTCLALLLAGCGTGSDEPDPVVVDKPIAYVMRPVIEDATTDIRVTQAFEAGGDLYLRDRASPTATEYNITGSITGGLGDVRDISVSFDGTKLLFSLRMPLIEGADPEDQPTWNLWEYNIETSQLRRVITSDITAEDGHDRFPHFLPDGRIVFSSTRQRLAKARLLDEGKSQYLAMERAVDEPAMVLHVMNEDGSDIKQISLNRSHDFSPSVLDSGKVVFSRWDNADGQNAIHLYRMNPDGTELELLYGVNSHDTGTNSSTIQFMRPMEMPDGQLLSLLLPFDGTNWGGAMMRIDSPVFVDNQQPTWQNNGLTGPAQTFATVHEVTTDGSVSSGGRLSSAFPLYDGTNRLLISWSQCRLMENGNIVPCTADRLANPNLEEAPPIYGIFIYDISDQTQLPIVAPQEGVIYSEVVAADNRPLPTVLLDKLPGSELDPTLVTEKAGLLHIRSIYDMDGLDTATPDIATLADPAQTLAAGRTARFLRLIKPVTIPDEDVLDFSNSAFGRTAQFGMREVVGYTPIEPDGSVQVKVPANVPVSFEVLDADGRKLNQNHPFWLQFRPGEVIECNGCHDPASPLPHGRLTAAPPSVNVGAPAGGVPFPNTNVALWTDPGETMAQTRNRLNCGGACDPTMDILFTDIWTDPAVRAIDPAISYRYDDLTTTQPMSDSTCDATWHSLCRSIIQYEQHIHPLWSSSREVLDGMGNVIDDHTCTGCHTSDNAGVAVEPDAQLDLTDGADQDEPEHFAAYHELLYPDDIQVINGGILVDLLEPQTDADGNQLYEVDADGNLVLDIDGNPIPLPDLPVPVPGGASMVAGSASAGRFLGKFDTGGTHNGYLTEAEKRLIAEWLDIGAQYYNNPFDAPLDN